MRTTQALFNAPSQHYLTLQYGQSHSTNTGRNGDYGMSP